MLSGPGTKKSADKEERQEDDQELVPTDDEQDDTYNDLEGSQDGDINPEIDKLPDNFQ